MSAIIHTHQLSFAFGKKKVLDNLSIEVPRNSIYGFLGPNGAGKSTTIRILLNLIRVPAQKVFLFNQDVTQHRIACLQKTGSLIENPSVYKHLSAKDNLEIIRRMLGVSKTRIGEVLEIVNLSEDAHRKVKEYSLGMCQRLGLATALLGNPELLILDEPLNGLDPAGINEMRALVLRLKNDFNKTIFLSSHILTEIEKTADYVGIIQKGKLRFQGTLQQLASEQKGHSIHIKTDDNVKSSKIIEALSYPVKSVNGSVEINVTDKESVATINKALVEEGIAVYELFPSQNNLESVFLNLTNS